jgi:hypothetical protein
MGGPTPIYTLLGTTLKETSIEVSMCPLQFFLRSFVITNELQVTKI